MVHPTLRSNMTGSVHVVGLCGSLAAESVTRISVRTALDGAAEVGGRTSLLDLRTYDLPPFDADEADAGDAIALRGAIDEADAIVLGSPVYHGSVASPLKTALDYCSRAEFEGKPVGLAVVAGGRFPKPTLSHLREISLSLDARPVPRGVCVPNAGSALDDGQFRDASLEARLVDLGRSVARYADVSEKTTATNEAVDAV